MGYIVTFALGFLGGIGFTFGCLTLLCALAMLLPLAMPSILLRVSQLEIADAREQRSKQGGSPKLELVYTAEEGILTYRGRRQLPNPDTIH